jgi:ribokinase
MPDHTVDVAAIGTLAVDYFALLPKLIGAEEKILSTALEVHAGGVAGNVLTQVARLGVRAGWLGKIGDDGAGCILLDEFENEDIDASHTEVVKGKFSMLTWIQVDTRGERSIIMFPNVLNELTGREVEEKHADYIRNAEVLHAEACVMPMEPVLRAMEIARESGTRVVFDLDVPPSGYVDEMRLGTREQIMRALELADVLIPCKSSAAELLGTDDILSHAGKLLEYGPKTVAITLGERGCVVFNGKERHEIGAFPVDVVDTTGAGDAFHGGFIYSILRGFDLEKAGRFANACGAICCRQVGARAMGTIEDVTRLMA